MSNHQADRMIGGLTKRQFEVAKLATEGLYDKEIADKLFICRQTAKHHLSAV